MVELTASQISDALRKCGGTIECDGCPYEGLGTPKCIQQMQKDAAAMIEGQQAILDQQVGELARIQALIPTS